MPERVNRPGEIAVGQFFESCAFHPCLCTAVEGADVMGLSLVDGRWVTCDLRHCGLRRLTLEEAVQWKLAGPVDEMLPEEERWWTPAGQATP